MTISSIRKDFPVTECCIFLSTCATGPISRQVAEALKDYYEHRLRGEDIPLDRYLADARENGAKLLAAKKHEIAFIRCTTEGINIIASMINWRNRDNVILNDMEFVSNVYPWMRQAKEHGIKIKCVKNVDERIPVEDIERAIDENTKVIAISHVQKSNGFRCDLEEIGKVAEERGILFVVDAIQSLGAISFDVKRMRVSFLVAGAQKWLLGPSGIGIMYAKEELIEEFEPMFVGPWQEDLDLSRITDFSYREYRLSSTARRYEFGGWPNVPGVMGLAAALRYLNTIGKEAIETRDMHLCDVLVEELRNANIQLPPWIDERNHRSAYIGVKTKRDTKLLTERAKERGIVVSSSKTIIGERLRIAPHFFNTEEEIIRAVEILKQEEA